MQAIRKIKAKQGGTIKCTLPSKLVISPLLYNMKMINETANTISKTDYRDLITCYRFEKRLQNTNIQERQPSPIRHIRQVTGAEKQLLTILETLGNQLGPTGYFNAEDGTLHSHRCQNTKPNIRRFY
jgi:hypothetical protein